MGQASEWAEVEQLGIGEPGLAALAVRGSFCRDGVSIEYSIFDTPGAKRHVLLLTGWDESFLKYAEVIRRLVDAGCAVYAMDHRGQGLSGRETEDPQVTYSASFDDYAADAEHDLDIAAQLSRTVTYVASFDDYAADVEHFLDITAQLRRPVSVVAHSMGGLVACALAARDAARFDRLFVCAPMFHMRAGMPLWVAALLAKVGCWLGMGKSYAPGQGPISHLAPLTNKLTTNREKLEGMHISRARFPQLAKGGMSFAWVGAAVQAQTWFRANMHRVRNPTVLVHAEDDAFVFNSAFAAFFTAAPHCRKVMYAGTYHEVLMERDAPRKHALDAMVHHITADAPLPPESVTVELATLPPRKGASAAAGLTLVAVAAAAAAGWVVSQSGRGYFNRLWAL
ncbi:alpha/beta hydrolase protein [Tribonema minus]|uniref:Alpha/beta hydrolase protein n=1 Tax=Tribonema minus TaxID=303371 RepID=A0A835Z9M5_9STRA|nr:alpha/beta hydrolase protein [Tribonema minus]